MLTQSGHKGIQTGISQEGIQIVRIHHSADPAKDRDTVAGKVWFKEEIKGYRGVTDPRWRKEMEIDSQAHGGQLLFPYLLEYQHQIFVKPYEIEGLTLNAGLDYGTRNPSAFEVLAVDYDSNIQTVWEYYEPPKTRDESDEQFRSRKGYKALSQQIKKCPYFGRNLPIFADPSLWNKNQESEDKKGLRSMADLFAQEGVYLSPGQRGRDFACYEKLDSAFWEDLVNPRFTIFRTCPWLWWELQRLRFADFTEATQVNRNLQEKIVDKDNHAWDAIKYPLMSMPQFTDRPKEKFSQAAKRIDALERDDMGSEMPLIQGEREIERFEQQELIAEAYEEEEWTYDHDFGGRSL